MSRAEREIQMLEVAERVFGERGYHTASMDDIAAEVGVSKPMLYNYFGSKEGLMVAVIQRARVELLERTIASMAGVTDERERLRASIRAFFEFLEDHRHGWSLLRQEQGLPEHEVEAIRAQQAEFIIASVVSDRPQTSRVQAEVVAQVILGACERVATLDLSVDEATDNLVAVLWNGLAGPAAR